MDTHSELYVAAALDCVGGLLGTREFPATAAGYASLLDWLGKSGDNVSRPSTRPLWLGNQLARMAARALHWTPLLAINLG